jgi:DNA-binding transcriptional ArsR family regulator
MAVPEPAFVTRIRTSGGPSHELLVLLDKHRVLTTSQLARATSTPERTVRYRLDRLREAHLVDCVRPGRESGSAPAHWWLRPAGARLVSGTAAAEGRRAPSGLFVAHSAAIAEVWLALVEHGPAVGVELVDWWTDRAGWQEWEAPGGYAGRLRRLTPDGVLHARVAGAGDAAAFVEVDLASMPQTLLREKVSRYLTYAADRAWEGLHPHCPPLLLLTTTETRAATFVRTARRLVDGDPDGDGLVVVACGLVRDPGRAVVEACWKLPDPAEAELTLAELLAERVAAQARAAHRYAREEALRRREDQLWRLGRAVASAHLDVRLGPAAGQALRHLVGADPGRFLDVEPELAGQVLHWWGRDGRNGGEGRAAAEALRGALQLRHRQLWAAHARTLLAAAERLAGDDPEAAGLARRLGEGQLLDERDLQQLAQAPPRYSRAQIQHELTAAYTARRDQDIERRLAAMGRRERRRARAAELAAAADAEQLLACDTCALQYPRVGDDGYETNREGNGCVHCAGGRLVDHAHRDQVATLTERLDAIRRRLAESVGPSSG